jgi:putative transposase
LITRAGTIELRVPRDRTGLFSIDLFERYQRSELCGHSFSASAISGMNRTLDAGFCQRSCQQV